MSSGWSVYLVRCRDGSLYTGITNDVDRRMDEHRSGARGAKYLRGRGPLRLAFEYRVCDRSQASRLEHRIKRLPAAVKQDPTELAHRIDQMLLDIANPPD
jgi:putative endonuclease